MVLWEMLSMPSELILVCSYSVGLTFILLCTVLTVPLHLTFVVVAYQVPYFACRLGYSSASSAHSTITTSHGL